MAEKTNIAWTDHTWNPWRGCQKVSPGCTNCYAEAMSKRNPSVLGIWGSEGKRVIASEASWREPLKWDRKARDEGVRRRVFCASMADVFEDRPELVAPRVRLFHLISETRNLDWLLLTKRPENIRRFHGSNDVPRSWPEDMPPNVWLGVSVEDQRRADERIPVLNEIEVTVRFLSCEPLLGPIDFDPARHNLYGRIHWCIVGGESGPGHRPMEVEWVRSIARQCDDAMVSCFVKQDSGPRPGQQGRLPADLWRLKELPQ
jgi:protein gp37